MSKQMSTAYAWLLAMGASAFLAAPASAQLTTTQVTSITGGVSFTTVLVGLGAIGLALVVVMVGVKGVRYLLKLLS